MASQPRMKTKAKWREELDKLCECVQSDRREPSQQCQPLDVQSRLNLDEERNLYSDAQLGALRLTNIQWLEFVKKMYNHWYYTSDQRDELISIFVRYDPDNDGLTQLDNFRWVMTTAGEGEELDEEVQREHVNYEGYRTPYSSEAVGSKLLKQAPHSILGKNPSNNTQNMLRFAVNVNLTWPVQVIHQFCEEEGLQSNQRHAQFKDDLSRALREEVQDHTVLDVAVGKGNFQVVETLVKLLLLCNVDQSTRARPLHNAITDGFDDIAYYLVTSFPNMIKEIVKGQSVLETVGQSKRLADKTKLEDFLLKKIYHVEGEPILVKRLLHGPLGNNKEYHLDLSCFNDPLYNLDTFLNHTKPSSGEDDMFSYIVLPKLLLYVGLPRIQGPSRQSRQEKLGRILEWLERRNVERILTLRMPDLEHNPYRDDDIVKYLTKFKEVEELNWEKLDMSLEILGDGDGNIHGVKKVWLYSASWGMISYWTSREGIINYPQIIHVNIIIIKSLIGFPKAQSYKANALNRLNERRKEAKENRRDLTYNVKIQEWDVPEAVDTSSPHPEVSQSSPSSILGLEPFLRYYRGLTLSPTDTSSNIDFSTRVAIIDTGVDISNPLLRARIQNGISYVQYGYECRESPWWLASDPHGTQMASLIQNIDPNSKLFIAKVGIDRKHVIEPEKILKGVQWALDQKVDIISISMTFYEYNEDLHKLLETAFENGVVVICSTADAGQLGPSVYPASWDDRTISVSACNRHFTPTDFTDYRATYFLPGEHVSATSLSYVEAEKTVSGSSVATAMASGLASLILSCRNYSRLAEGHTRSTGMQRRQAVKNVFSKMLEAQTGKSVVPDRVFNEEEAVKAVAQDHGPRQEDSQPRRADDATWRKWIREHFGHLMVYDVRE